MIAITATRAELRSVIALPAPDCRALSPCQGRPCIAVTPCPVSPTSGAS